MKLTNYSSMTLILIIFKFNWINKITSFTSIINTNNITAITLRHQVQLRVIHLIKKDDGEIDSEFTTAKRIVMEFRYIGYGAIII